MIPRPGSPGRVLLPDTSQGRAMKDDTLPLWSAAQARERRAGIRPVDPPPPQKAPRKPKRPRRPKRREPEAPPTATVVILPLYRNRREMAAVLERALARDPKRREAYLAGFLERLAEKRRAAGQSEGWIAAERRGILDALDDLLAGC